MQTNVAVAVIVAGLIIAAGLVAHGGLYQLVGTGPDTAYVVHRLTGGVRYVTGTTLQPVRNAPAGIEKGYGK